MSINKNKGPLLESIFNGTIDLVPPKWRARLGITRTAQEVPLDILPDPMASFLVGSQVTQERTDERLKTNVVLGDPTDKTFVEYFKTKDGQIATRIIKYVPEGTPLPTITELTIEAQQEASGNGWSEQIFSTVPNLFGANDYAVELRDVVPPEFAALLKTFDTEETVAGIAVMPTLLVGDLRRSETQLTEQTKRTTRRYRDLVSLPVVIVDKGTNREKQVTTITKTLELDTVPPVLPTAIKDTEFSKLGNGMAVQVETTVDLVFVGAVYSKNILNLIPEKLRAVVPLRSHDYTVQDSAVNPDPILATGELTHKETQIDEFNKRVESTSIDAVSGAVVADSLVTFEFGGTEAERTMELITHGSQPLITGPRVLKCEITNLNNGWDVRETLFAIDVTWAALPGQDYDERLNVVIPYTQQVRNTGDLIGLPLVDVKPIDKWKEETKTVDLTAAAAFLSTYSLSYFGRVNIDLPDKLISLAVTMDTNRGEGASSETGTFTGSGSFSVSQALRATAQSSSSMVPEVTAVVKQFWGNNIPCTNYQFFLPSPVTSADVLAKLATLVGGSVSPWPKYNPEMVTLVITGGKVSVQSTASSQGSLATSTSGNSSTAAGGTGYSRDQTLSIRSMRISPTIHAAITVSGLTSSSDTVSATASAQATGLGPFETQTQSSSVSASVTPTTVLATLGAVDWPTTGKFAFRVDAQPYRFGYIQVHAVVVDAADFPTNP